MKLGVWTIVGGLLLALGSGRAPAQETPAPTAAELVAALEKTVTEVVAKADDSVVAIARVRRDAREPMVDVFDLQPGRFRAPNLRAAEPDSPDFIPQEYGTGVIIDRGGLILTAYHVLGDPRKNEYFVWSEKRPFAATVIAADPWLDLAVLKIEASDLTPIKFGDAKELKKGQFVIALGNPHAIARDGEVSTTWGMISNLDRPAPVLKERASATGGRETLHHYGNLIQTDARLERGTSGGALVNLSGEMIGLTTSLPGSMEEGSDGGFAIPVDQAFKDAVETLKTGRKVEYGFLGVAPEHLSFEERRQGKRGARVSSVVVGTPAANIGLAEQRFDDDDVDVITHIDGEEVADANDLIMRLSKLPAEKKVELTIERSSRASGGKPRVLRKEVTLSKKYMDTARAVYATVADPKWRGLTVDYATAAPNFRERANVTDSAGCVAVLDVERGSSAWKAGIRSGMFLSHVGKTRVATPSAFHEAAAKARGAIDVRITEPISGETTVRVAP